jgi:hypothetical protein
VVDAHLVLGRGGRKAYIVTSTGPTFEVDLPTWRVRTRLPSRRLGDPSRYQFSWFADQPVRVGDKIAVSTPTKVKLLDTRRFRVSPVSATASSFIASSGSLLYLSPGPYGPSNELMCVTSTGKVRFRLPFGAVNEFHITKRYGYASTDRGMAIVDLEQGKIVRRVDGFFMALLLPPPRGPKPDSL